jgi:WD40 repeat protein
MSIKGDEKRAIEIDGGPDTSDDTGGPSPRIVTVDQRDANLIKIDHPGMVFPVAFLAGGKEVVSGGMEGNIRRWRVEDGMEVGIPMDTGSSVYDLAVSRDGKWIVAGTRSGQVVVWNTTSFEKETDFKANNGTVNAVDISTDGSKIVAGSLDRTVSVWSLPTQIHCNCHVEGVRSDLRQSRWHSPHRLAYRSQLGFQRNPRLDGRWKTSLCLVCRR